MQATDWRAVGRFFAWLGAACLAGVSLYFLLLAFGLLDVPTAPFEIGPETAAALGAELDLVWAHGALWPSVAVRQALLTLAFWSMIPVGMALRELLGRTAAWSRVMAAAFLVGGILGGVASILEIGRRLEFTRLAPMNPSLESLVSLHMSAHVWDVATASLTGGAYFLLGVGIVIASSRALRLKALPAAWARLGLITAAGLFLNEAVRASGLRPQAAAAVAAAALLVTAAWAYWLGRELVRGSESIGTD